MAGPAAETPSHIPSGGESPFRKADLAAAAAQSTDHSHEGGLFAPGPS
jgi:hypothetical protein